MKKLIKILLICALMLFALSVTASAETEGYYTYTVSNGEATITDVDENISGAVAIPSALGGYPVTVIDEYAFEFCYKITNVGIPDSINAIRDSAFIGCSGLTNVLIPDSVTWLGHSAFSCCYNLETAIIGNGISHIYDAFEYCENLKKVTIGKNVEYIGISTFTECYSLTDVYYNDDEKAWDEVEVQEYGNETFLNATFHFEDIEIIDSGNCGENVMYKLDEYGLLTIYGTGEVSVNAWRQKAEEIKDVVIENGITAINYDVFFDDCYNLTSVTIPASVVFIDGAFLYCENLEQIMVNENNPNYCSIDGNLFNKDKTELIQYAIGKSDTSYIIPDSVTSISYSAFEGCYSLENIEFSNSITHVGARALEGTQWLDNQPDGVVYAGKVLYKYKGTMPKNTSIEIKEGTVSISTDAFNYCKNLVDITIPNSVSVIGDYAFFYTMLTGVTIPDGVVTIGELAFSRCEELIDVTIPKSVVTIDYGAFRRCESLQRITVDDNNTKYCSVDGNLFNKEKTKLIQYAVGKIEDSYIVPDSVTAIDSNAFRYSKQLTNITIGKNVNSIKYNAFSECDSLISINVDEYNTQFCSVDGNLFSKDKTKLLQYAIGKTKTYYIIPESVVSVDDEAFYGCDNLINVEIPDNVMHIGDYAFSDCYNLTNIKLPNGITSIGNGMFESCSKLTNIDIPDSVVSIGNGAFYGCESLINVEIPDSVTTIDNDAFAYCDSLKYAVIGNSVTTIGRRAFESCNSLTSVEISDSVTTIGEGAFANCEGMKSVIIGKNVTKIERIAFFSCYDLTDVYYSGNEEQWENIIISQGNDKLLNANIYFSSKPVEVEFKIYNNEPVSVLFTTYDTKSKMLNIVQKTIENTNKETVAVDSKTQKYKILYWESLTNLKPVYAPIEKEL